QHPAGLGGAAQRGGLAMRRAPRTPGRGGRPPHGRGLCCGRRWAPQAAAARLPATLPARQRQARRTPASCPPIPSNRGLPEGGYGTMTLRSQVLRLLAQEDLNFLLTNRIPRRLVTRFMGWFSRIQQPLLRDLSIGLWRFFCHLDLSEAKKQHFRSMHDCFIRELKDGARPIHGDPEILVSPCDAIIGACGTIAGTTLYQIKGFPY